MSLALANDSSPSRTTDHAISASDPEHGSLSEQPPPYEDITCPFPDCCKSISDQLRDHLLETHTFHDLQGLTSVVASLGIEQRNAKPDVRDEEARFHGLRAGNPHQELEQARNPDGLSHTSMPSRTKPGQPFALENGVPVARDPYPRHEALAHSGTQLNTAQMATSATIQGESSLASPLSSPQHMSARTGTMRHVPALDSDSSSRNLASDRRSTVGRSPTGQKEENHGPQVPIATWQTENQRHVTTPDISNRTLQLPHHLIQTSDPHNNGNSEPSSGEQMSSYSFEREKSPSSPAIANRNPFTKDRGTPEAYPQQAPAPGTITQLTPADQGHTSRLPAAQSEGYTQGSRGMQQQKSEYGKNQYRDGDRPKKDGPDDSDGDGSREQKRPRIGFSGDDHACERFLACPYHQNNPAAHRTSACTGPGFPTFSPLRQHVFRLHSRKHSCFRCYRSFKSQADLQVHSRAATVCDVTNGPKDYLVDEQTWECVKHEWKSAPGASDGERWKIMYRVLFPNESFIPSPYYSLSSTEAVQEYYDFAKSQTMRVARSLINPEAGSRQRQSQFQALCKMLERCHFETFERYKSRKGHSGQGPNPSPATSTEELTSHSRGLVTSQPGGQLATSTNVSTTIRDGIAFTPVDQSPRNQCYKHPEMSQPLLVEGISGARPPDFLDYDQSFTTNGPFIPRGTASRFGAHSHSTATQWPAPERTFHELTPVMGDFGNPIPAINSLKDTDWMNQTQWSAT